MNSNSNFFNQAVLDPNVPQEARIFVTVYGAAKCV